MMKSKSAQKIKLTSYDDLFGTNEQPSGEVVTSVPINLFHAFKDHPFRVVDDEKMQETVESVKKYGILMPGIVRPHPENGYESLLPPSGYPLPFPVPDIQPHKLQALLPPHRW